MTRRRRCHCQGMQGIANGVSENGGMPVLNDSCQRAVEIESKQRFGLTGQPIEDTLACGAEHVLHRCDYRPRPEACPTCFITRIRRRIRAASINIRPAHRYTLNS
jgi:hypothetical protein